MKEYRSCERPSQRGRKRISPKRITFNYRLPKTEDLQTPAKIPQDNIIFLPRFSAVGKGLSQFQQHIEHDLFNQISLSKEEFTNSTELHSFFVLNIYIH